MVAVGVHVRKKQVVLRASLEKLLLIMEKEWR